MSSTCSRPSTTPPVGWLPTPSVWTPLQTSVRVSGLATALAQQLAGEVVTTEAAEHAHGTGAGSWLAETTRLTRKEAAALLFAGRDLSRFPIVSAASLEGAALPQQARAITRVLSDLPEDLPAAVVTQAEVLMVGYAGQFNSAELSKLSRHLLEVLAPEIAEASEAERLEREYQQAVRNRHLEFHHDGHGTTHIRGSLPTVDAAALIEFIDSYAAQQKRAIEAIDPLPAHAFAGPAAGGRPDGARPPPCAGVPGPQPRRRPAAHRGDARLREAQAALHRRPLLRWASRSAPRPCASWPATVQLLPAVLNGPSQPLDVGRLQRLVTGPIRAALELRDRGCAFPGCNKPPKACHAHHIIPWWTGGSTALGNLVLLCPHHHNIVEPSRREGAQRWTIECAADEVRPGARACLRR